MVFLRSRDWTKQRRVFTEVALSRLLLKDIITIFPPNKSKQEVKTWIQIATRFSAFSTGGGHIDASIRECPPLSLSRDHVIVAHTQRPLTGGVTTAFRHFCEIFSISKTPFYTSNSRIRWNCFKSNSLQRCLLCGVSIEHFECSMIVVCWHRGFPPLSFAADHSESSKLMLR